MLHDVQNVFEVPVLSHTTLHIELLSNHQNEPARRSQRLETQPERVDHQAVHQGHKTLGSREDNPQITGPVYKVISIIFQLSFL